MLNTRRPPTPKKDRKTQLIGFKLEPDLARDFRRAASGDGGVSVVLRRFVRRYLKRRTAA